MKVKTSELTGAALNWVVASIEWPNDTAVKSPWDKQQINEMYPFHCDGTLTMYIFERERISLRAPKTYWPYWGACVYIAESSLGMVDGHAEYSATMLEAGLRCHVFNKLGDEVEVPDNLL